jgi:hypothetical protein
MMLALVLSSALAAPPGWALAPFGVGVYVHGHPGRGAVYTATQAVGFGTALAASLLAGTAADAGDEAGMATYGTVAAASVTLGITSWFVSSLDASRLHELESPPAASAVRAWDAARARAVPSPTSGGPS